MNAASGKIYIIGENVHHEMQIPKETLHFEEPDRRRKNDAYVADANVCSMFRMHFGHPASANAQGDAVFGRAMEEPERVCRHVIY